MSDAKDYIVLKLYATDTGWDYFAGTSGKLNTKADTPVKALRKSLTPKAGEEYCVIDIETGERHYYRGAVALVDRAETVGDKVVYV